MKAIRFIVESLLLIIGSIIAGFLIACIVHYISFGIWGYGLGREAAEMALFEGGTAGVMMAIPTGLIAYYGILRRRLSSREVGLILLGSLTGGLILGAATLTFSMILIPLWTVAVAAWIKRRREPARQPETWVA